MSIDSNNWGGVVIDPNPKKKSIILDIDMATGTVKSKKEISDDTKAEKMARIKRERAAKLGLK